MSSQDPQTLSQSPSGAGAQAESIFEVAKVSTED